MLEFDNKKNVSRKDPQTGIWILTFFYAKGETMEKENKYEEHLRIIYISVEYLQPTKTKKSCKSKFESLEQSFEEFGIFAPIIVAGIQSKIIDGNARYWLAKKLKIKRLPCVRADFISPQNWKRLQLLANTK